MTVAAPAGPRAPARARHEVMWLGLLCLVAIAWIVVLGMRLSFFNDDWYFLLQRPGLESHGGLDTLLAPHNGNMVVLLAGAYRLLVAVFGMHSQLPFRLVLGVSWAALGVIVYALVRPRTGPAVAWLAAAVVLFLGPAWEASLFFAGINHVWALELGLASLLLLARDSPARNVAACAALTAAVAASNTGIAMVAGAAVAILGRRRPRQLWIVGVPLAVYGLWWLTEGSGQSTGVTAGHIRALPGYVFDAFSSGLASVLGLNHGALPEVVYSGHLVAVLAVIGGAVWLVRGGRPRGPALWFGGALVAFWLLTGASAIPGRSAVSSRYQITDVALMLVLAAELAHGWRPGRIAAASLSLVCVAIVASNTIVLRDGYGFLHSEADFVAADTGALQIARAYAPPQLWLLAGAAGNPYLSGVTAGRYFAQTAAHGTPPFDSPAALARAGGRVRAAADGVLIAAERVHTTLGHAASRGDCAALAPASGAPATVALRFGDTVIANASRTTLALGLSRFGAPSSAHVVAFLPPGATEVLTLPVDRASLAWRLTAIDPSGAPGRVTVCRA